MGCVVPLRIRQQKAPAGGRGLEGCEHIQASRGDLPCLVGALSLQEGEWLTRRYQHPHRGTPINCTLVQSAAFRHCSLWKALARSNSDMSSMTDRTLSLCITFWRWALIVRSVVFSSCAICLFSLPATTSAYTC